MRSLSLSLMILIVLGLAGCGSGDSATTSTATSVTVERGKVFDANVTDANGQVATQNSGTNVYVFATTPAFPVTVTGGWIDVDGDGNQTAADVLLTLPLKSYTTEVTAVSTYIADANATLREKKLQDLATKMGVNADELRKLPSKSIPSAIATQNAIYKQIKANDNNISAVTLNAVKVDFDTLDALAQNNSATTGAALAKLLEGKVVADLETAGKVTKSTKAVAPNAAPIANAGADQNVTSGATLTLDASSSSDSDGSIASYFWTDGNTTLGTTASVSTSSLSIGTHTISLIVTDNGGAIGTDTVVVTVNAPNVAPTANAGADQNVTSGATVTLSGSASSDSDGTIVNYTWNDGATTLGTGVSLQTSSLSVGTHTITLTVTDDANATGTDTVVVTVNAIPNVAPTANAGADQNVTSGATVTLSGSASSDSDGTIVNYTWNDGATTLGTGVSLQTSSLSVGTHTITLTVTDDANATGTDTVVVTIYTAQSGTLVDPYIVGSVLCQDTNGNNVCDSGEPTSTITTTDGNFTFNAPLTTGTNIIIQTQGVHSGKTYDLNISGVVAADGSIAIVSPLTTFESRGLTATQITNILLKAKDDAIAIDSATNLTNFTIPTPADILNDPLSGGLLSKKLGAFTDADLVKIQASLTTYGLLKIINGSTTLRALNGTELELSGTTTGGEINLLARNMLKIISDNINTTLLGTLKGQIDAGRQALIDATLDPTIAASAIPEPTMGVIVDIAVKVIDDLSTVGFTACNNEPGTDAQKVTAALTAVGTRFATISPNMQTLIDNIYGLTYKTELQTLPSAFQSGFDGAKPNIAVGRDTNSSVTTFIFDGTTGNSVPFVNP